MFMALHSFHKIEHLLKQPHEGDQAGVSSSILQLWKLRIRESLTCPSKNITLSRCGHRTTYIQITRRSPCWKWSFGVNPRSTGSQSVGVCSGTFIFEASNSLTIHCHIPWLTQDFNSGLLNFLHLLPHHGEQSMTWDNCCFWEPEAGLRLYVPLSAVS